MLVGELQHAVLSAKGYTSYKHFSLEAASMSLLSAEEEIICRYKEAYFQDRTSGLIREAESLPKS